MSADCDDTYSRSDAVLKQWEETGHTPSEAERANYWRLHARDVIAKFKSVNNQMVLALTAGCWGLAKAKKTERAIADLERRLVALERRLESEKRGFHYRGTWQEGEVYDEGDFATNRGSLWHCNAASTTTRPGESDDWQLGKL